MALEGDKDFLKVPDPTWTGCPLFFSVVGMTGLRIYDLWRDWQHHRFVWEHVIFLLICVFLVAMLWYEARKARSQRDKMGEGERDDEPRT